MTRLEVLEKLAKQQKKKDNKLKYLAAGVGVGALGGAYGLNRYLKRSAKPIISEVAGKTRKYNSKAEFNKLVNEFREKEELGIPKMAPKKMS